MRIQRTLLTPSLAAAVMLLSPALAAAQSTSIADYVLLARTSLRAKALTVLTGDVGVTTGTLVTRNELDAPNSDLAGPSVKMDKKSSCATVYADAAMGTGPNCGPAQDFTSPFADLAAACEFPVAFPACNPGAPVVVVNGTTTVLPPGVYGDIQVSGGSGGPAVLELNGSYTFCSVRVARNGVVRFTGPSTMNVRDTILLSTSADMVPASPVTAQDVRVFVDGRSVRFSRLAKVGALVCAPKARLSAGSGATLEGRFVADAIRMRQNRVATSGMPPETTTTTIATTTTTTTSTSTTTLPGPVCGNGVLEVGEECDTNQFGSATCPGSSVAGAFLVCTAGCTIDFSGCPAVTTTTTEPPATTTTTTEPDPTTTTTSLPVETTTTTSLPVETTTTTSVPVETTTTTSLPVETTTTTSLPVETTTTTSLPVETTTTTTQPEPTTTTTTLEPPTTTTTTLPAVCGNGVLEPGEECDTNQFGSATCPGSSVAGAFLVCTAGCTIDFSGCPAVTTTTTEPPATTTTTTEPDPTTTTTSLPVETTTTTTLPGETTTTTTLAPPTTTTTTLPAVCGNGVLEPGEECDTDQFGNATCPGSSVVGAFLGCTGSCTIDFSECPGTTTTTTLATTTTTVASTTTTTTLTPGTTTTTTIPGACGNGVIEGNEQCDDGNTVDCDGCSSTCQVEEVGNGVVECEEECDDGNTVDCDGCSSTGTIEGCGNNVAECDEVCDGTDLNGGTCPGSPNGALLCNEDCSGYDTSQCGTPQTTEENCTNCIDDNGDGLIDFEDPQCCSAPNAFISSVRKGDLKPRKNGRSFLRLREVLDQGGGLQLQPMKEQVSLQIRQGDNELLCARVPAGKFMKMGKWYKFWAKKSAKNQIIKTDAQGIEDMAIRIKSDGTVRYKAYGRRVMMTTPPSGNLEITVGFTDPTIGNASNRCSRVIQPFTSKGTKGALKAP